MIDINAKIMEAMKSHDKIASETYKMLKAKILEYKTAKNAKPYDDSAEISLINKMIKERTDTALIYRQNGREELAQNEESEANVLLNLLPKLPTEEDIMAYIDEHYPNGVEKSAIGSVIKEVKTALVGAEGRIISQIVKDRLV